MYGPVPNFMQKNGPETFSLFFGSTFKNRKFQHFEISLIIKYALLMAKSGEKGSKIAENGPPFIP